MLYIFSDDEFSFVDCSEEGIINGSHALKGAYYDFSFFFFLFLIFSKVHINECQGRGYEILISLNLY